MATSADDQPDAASAAGLHLLPIRPSCTMPVGEAEYDIHLQRAIATLQEEISSLEQHAAMVLPDARPRLQLAHSCIEDACRWLRKELDREG